MGCEINLVWDRCNTLFPMNSIQTNRNYKYNPVFYMKIHIKTHKIPIKTHNYILQLGDVQLTHDRTFQKTAIMTQFSGMSVH